MKKQENEKILLFIPGYNCEKQIVRVLKQLDSEIMKYIDEVIFVNNRSTDNTEKVVLDFKSKEHMDKLKVLRNKQNYGLGGSHKVAINYAKANGFSHFIVLHGDDQGSIKDILPILKSDEYKKYDCVLGARFMKNSKLDGYSKFRTLGNRVYNILFSVVAKKRIYDLGSGLNLYSVKMFDTNFHIRFADNLTFNCYMLLAADYYKHKVKFFPISWREDDQVSNVKMMNQAMNTLKLLTKYLLRPGYFIKSELRTMPKEEYSADIIS